MPRDQAEMDGDDHLMADGFKNPIGGQKSRCLENRLRLAIFPKQAITKPDTSHEEEKPYMTRTRPKKARHDGAWFDEAAN